MRCTCASACSPACPAACCSHTISLSTVTTAPTDAVPMQFDRDADGIVIRPVPESEVSRRFPAGSFRIDPGQGTVIERVGGDELLFVDDRSRQQPYLTLVTGKATAVSFRITGGLIPASDRMEPVADFAAEVAAEQSRAERFWHDMTGALTLR